MSIDRDKTGFVFILMELFVLQLQRKWIIKCKKYKYSQTKLNSNSQYLRCFSITPFLTLSATLYLDSDLNMKIPGLKQSCKDMLTCKCENADSFLPVDLGLVLTRDWITSILGITCHISVRKQSSYLFMSIGYAINSC